MANDAEFSRIVALPEADDDPRRIRPYNARQASGWRTFADTRACRAAQEHAATKKLQPPLFGNSRCYGTAGAQPLETLTVLKSS
jgi:hypothetical protein